MSPRKQRRNPNVDSLLDRLGDLEEEFLQREFLSPALRGGNVRVRIGKVVCQIRIEPPDFVGWGVFQPTSHRAAKLVRQATMAERRKYLDLFPLVRLIICRRAGNTWFGSAASFGDKRIQIDGLAPLQLAESVQLFDCVQARFDGVQFWFDEVDRRHNPVTASFMRTELANTTRPDELHRPGLTAEERAAYEVNYWPIVMREALADSEPAPGQQQIRRRGRRRGEMDDGEADPQLRRLRESLSHAGAQLVDYLERPDSFRVRYLVGGQQYTSSVDKEDLSVQVAGICLSGEDQKFDLASLVGVLREGDQHGEVLHVGDEAGIDEAEYWRIHPRRR